MNFINSNYIRIKLTFCCCCCIFVFLLLLMRIHRFWLPKTPFRAVCSEFTIYRRSTGYLCGLAERFAKYSVNYSIFHLIAENQTVEYYVKNKQINRFKVEPYLAPSVISRISYMRSFYIFFRTLLRLCWILVLEALDIMCTVRWCVESKSDILKIYNNARAGHRNYKHTDINIKITYWNIWMIINRLTIAFQLS